MNVLVDTREIAYEDLTAFTIREFARVFKQRAHAIGAGKWAIVVQGQLGFGLARMWEFMIDVAVSFRTSVFKSMDEAEEWVAGRNDLSRFNQ